MYTYEYAESRSTNRAQLDGEKKQRRQQELAGNRERLRESAGRQKRALRRRRICLGAAAALACVLAVGAVRYREAGETGGRQFKIRESGEGRIPGTEGQGREGQKTDLLMLVNKDHALPEGYSPQLHWLNNRSCAVAEEMYGALKEMLTDGSDEGLQFVVASGYRDTEYQQKLLDEDIEASMESEGLTWQQAYEKETRETMPPGHSEHETGLAADIVSLGYQMLDAQQETTAENQWLRENCSRYGFILRYPRGKEEITQVDYESWHFRYVGVEAAQEIMSRGITLEEYLGEE